MKLFNHLDEEYLEQLLHQQQTMAWNALDCVEWQRGVDFNKPFVPLDENNIAFPTVSKEERLVISQYMGMMIASVFSEMEITMDRLKKSCWEPLMKRYATSPELIALGDNFFIEEAKHAVVFQRFLDLCAEKLNLDPDDLKSTLPRVRDSYVDKVIESNAFIDGLSMWWIVATVEEESQLIFRQLKPHKKHLDPVYYQLHQRHFEEEARHAPYAFIMLEMGAQKKAPWHKLIRKTDYLVSEILKSFWLFFELYKSLDVSHLKNHNEFYKILHQLRPKLSDQNLMSMFGSMLNKTPYISAFVNPLFHPYLKKEIANRRVFKLPLPEPEIATLCW